MKKWIMYAELSQNFLLATKNKSSTLHNYLINLFYQQNSSSKKSLPSSYYSRVSFKFGAITMAAGILGVPLGAFLSTKLSKRYPRCDPVICAMGLLISAPLIAGSMLMVTVNSTLAYILVFFGEIALNLNWAIVADMLLVRFHKMFNVFLLFLCFIISNCPLP